MSKYLPHPLLSLLALTSCIKENLPEKAMITALLFADFKKAIKVLMDTQGKQRNKTYSLSRLHVAFSLDERLKLAAFALACLLDDSREPIEASSTAMWKEITTKVVASLSHIYIRIIFAIASGQEIQSLLLESKLSVSDQMTFACRLLPDAEVGLYSLYMMNSDDDGDGR
jgi:hypothetical protein